MATYKPGRLRRTLNKIIGTTPLISMSSSTLGTIQDNTITSIVVHRGKSVRGGGSHPSTLEVGLKGRYSAGVAGSNVTVKLNAPAATSLAAHLSVAASTITDRFTGRLATASIDDTGKKFHTTYGAASWIAQMNHAKRKYTPAALTPMLSVIAGLLDAGNSKRHLDVYLFGDADKIATARDPVTYGDGIGPYAADIGILLQETRDGRTNVLPLEWRMANALTLMNSRLPLTRSQAISPATWEQRNENAAIRVEYKVTNQTGDPATRVAETTIGPDDLRETVEIDWAYIRTTNNAGQLYREALARVYESSERIYTIPSITIDLLALIKSDKAYHLKQAGQLLQLEAGDPVFFSGDWPDPVDGIHFAEGITETITPDEWKLELSLVPCAIAVGDKPTGKVPPRVWDSARITWNQETRKWNEA